MTPQAKRTSTMRSTRFLVGCGFYVLNSLRLFFFPTETTEGADKGLEKLAGFFDSGKMSIQFRQTFI